MVSRKGKMIRVKKFRLIYNIFDDEVEAVGPINHDNVSDAADWCDGEVWSTRRGNNARTHGILLNGGLVRNGDYIVKNHPDYNGFTRLPAVLFKAYFEPIHPDEKPSVDVPQYQVKNKPIEAIQILVGDEERVAEWTGGKIVSGRPDIIDLGNGDELYLTYGDYVRKLPNGGFVVVPAVVFNEIYEEMPD